MTFARQTAGIVRPELRADVAGKLSMWPTVDGANVLVSGTPTYSIRDLAGTEIQAGNCTTATITGGSGESNYSRIDVAVTAIGTKDEGYTCRISWSDGTYSYQDVIVFDVVAYPISDLGLSANDLTALAPDAEFVLERLGGRLGYAQAVAAESAAGIYGAHAVAELQDRIQSKVRDASLEPDANRIRTGGPVFARANLILDRARMKRVAILFALALVYEADNDGTDTANRLAEKRRADAEGAWMGLPPLAYDVDEDLIPDDTVSELGRVTILQRAC